MNLFKRLLKKCWVFIILIFTLALTFPGLILGRRSMFWDITLFNLPLRYHLSECINNGYLPLWNGWMNYGFPQMGHYETWYPVSWVFALLFKYNLSILQFEYLFNLLIAGIGFYFFSSLLGKISKPVRIFGAISYMLCGVFISQATHLGYVTSGTWMPLVLYSFLRLTQNPSLFKGLAFVFFYFLLVTGGYAGNYIVITYIIAGIFFYQIIRSWRLGEKEKVIKLIKYLFLITPVFVLMYAVVFYPSMQLQSHITRASLEYNNIGFGAQTGSSILNGYWTVLSPSANVFKNTFWGENTMLNDTYFGIIPVIFILYFLIYGRNSNYYKRSVKLLLIGIFFAAISLAIELPIHKLLYRILPLLDYFRFPSLYRIFFIFAMVSISCLGLDYWLKQPKDEQKNLRKVLLILLPIYITTFVIFFHSNMKFSTLFKGWDDAIKILDQNGFIIIDLVFIGIAFIVLLFLKWNIKINSIVIILLVCFDMIFHTWVRTPRYVSSPAMTEIVNNQIQSIPEGFPANIPNMSVLDWQKKNLVVNISWYNRYLYGKYPQLEGQSPYALKTYRTVLRNGLLDTLQHYPLFMVMTDTPNSTLDLKLYDSSATNEIMLSKTTPNSFHFTAHNLKDKYIIFNHNYYPGWEVYENGELQEHKIIEENFLAFEINSHTSKIDIVFNPKVTKILFWISTTVFCLLSFYLIITLVKKKTHSN